MPLRFPVRTTRVWPCLGLAFAFAFASASVAVGCAEDSNRVEYGVFGDVRDAASGDGVSGVRVTFSSDTLYTASDRTDGDGRYEILVRSDTPFGHLRTEDGSGRYAPAVVDVYFDDDTRRVDIDLAPSRD